MASQLSQKDALTDDLCKPRFLMGENSNRWVLIDHVADVAIIDVAAREIPGSPSWYSFRFLTNNYPVTAPAGCLWDSDLQAPLPQTQWPKGPDASRVFNPGWNASAIYLPVDRIAQNGHEAWRSQAEHRWWSSSSDICQYLNELWSILNSSGYQGNQ
jgi:hypothetical protein